MFSPRKLLSLTVISALFFAVQSCHKVAKPIAVPGTIRMGVVNELIVTSKITTSPIGRGQIPTDVRLLRVDSHDVVTHDFGMMRDDGANGDAVAGDQIFTLKLTVTELAIGEMRLCVGADFPDSRKWIRSPVSAIPIVVANTAPVVNAGMDQVILLGAMANLSGTASDDGLPSARRLTFSWSQSSGPGTVVFGDVNALVTTASFSAQGNYELKLSASDSELTSADQVTIIVNPANLPPSVTVSGPISGTQFTAPASITLSAIASDSDGSVLKVEFFEAGTKLGETTTIPYSLIWNKVGAGNYSVTARATDHENATTTSNAVNIIVKAGAPLPPDPVSVAPPLNLTVASDIKTSAEFLYTGNNPIQSGVAAGTINLKRAAVLRGAVKDRNGAPSSGVKISILDHPEFGHTFSRADGLFDLAVNGGGWLTVNYEKAGLIPAQRQINSPWQNYSWLSEVIMIPFDTAVTVVDLRVSGMQVARGSAVSDADGARQATVMVPAATTAEMVLPDGSRQALTTLHVRATEYTIGDSGPQAMPASLPPSSGYTYAAELSVDEAVSAGATDVRFSQALPVYVENFLGFPVGTAVPTGFYDRNKAQWVPSANGRVIKVLGITDGLADLDLDGNGAPEDAVALSELGVTREERMHLAQLYAPGQTLWRVPITHFTPWDCNWPYGPPLDAISPPGKDPDENNPPVDRPHEECGSIIGCEAQTLGESLSISGTPWRLHYRSGRTPGRKDAYTLNIPVSGNLIPASLLAIRVEVSIAGRLYQTEFAPAPNLSYVVIWDGKDGYGRPMRGAQPAGVQVHYDYALQYYAVSRDLDNSFARAADAGGFFISRGGASAYTLSTAWTTSVGSWVGVWDARVFGLGGWSLSVQHAYDPVSHTLLLGDGGQRHSGEMSSTITTVAGTGMPGYSGDGGPALNATLHDPCNIAFGPDGSVYFADVGNHRVRRMEPDGVITTVAGTGVIGFSGDNGPAVEAMLNTPSYVAVGPEGSLFIADAYNYRIRRVGTDGVITTVAGTGVIGFSGDNGPAVEAALSVPFGLAVGPDGSLYIADYLNNRIRRIGPDHIITTVAGNGGEATTIFWSSGSAGDGGPALKAILDQPVGVAVGPDGSLYVAQISSRIRRVRPDGIITTVAGNGDTFGTYGDDDGGLAVEAKLSEPRDIAVGPDGSLYIADENAGRIRRIRPNGIITTVAGTNVRGFNGDGGSAVAASLFLPFGIAVAPDGSLFIADTGNNRIRHVGSALPDVDVSNILLSSEDGRERYLFTGSGRHLKTLDALTGGLRYQFDYSADGYLTSVTDGSGNVTTIERSGALPSAIVASGGEHTALTVDDDGWLLSMTNPAGEAHKMTYNAEGLMQRYIDPLGHIHAFTYDTLGRLVKDEDAAGSSSTLSRSQQTNGYTVTTTSSLGRAHAYQVEQLPTGAIRRTVTQPGGPKTVTVINTDDSEQTTVADGTIATIQFGPDPRWGMLAPLPKSLSMTTGGLTSTLATARTTSLADPNNPFSPAMITDTVIVNRRIFKSSYDSATKTATSTSAEGRQSNTVIDSLGRVVQSEVTGLVATSVTYDTRGRLAHVKRGTGVDARTTSLTYNNDGLLDAVTDPLGRTLSFAYDAAGRVTRQSLPGGRVISYGYDVNGNITSLTPPGRPVHLFSYTSADLQGEYTPPDVGLGSTKTRYSYNLDKQLTRVTRPDGQVLDFSYDAVGRLETLTLPMGKINYSYEPTASKLTGITVPDGDQLTYTYSGALLIQTAWAGTVVGDVSNAYDSDLRVTALNVNGANAIAFQYDGDSLLTKAGDLTLSRNAQNGMLATTTLGNVTDTLGYNDFGEQTTYSATYVGSEFFKTQFSYDKLGRMTTKLETVLGNTAIFDYGYDLTGQLTEVKKDSAVIAAYTYDSNGNRLTAPDLSQAPSYDHQDRLTQYGETTYAYSANGELKTKTAGALVTSYDYDVLGNLKHVTLPDGSTIEYVVDGQNRRIGKKVNGVLIQGFLYQGQLSPIAELDAANHVVSRFVYATKANTPAYMVKGGVSYRIITDHLGSPRLVVDIATGTIVQQMDYDEYGRVLTDTNPGFQPFGFAGGLNDRDTKLVQFGARDYDPLLGRWTNKDPIRFQGGDNNLYIYCGNDPPNCIDPSGLALDDDLADWIYDSGLADVDLTALGDFSAGFGDKLSFGLSKWIRTDLYNTHNVDECSNWYQGGEVAGDTWRAIMLRQGVQPGGWMNANRYLRIGWSRLGGNRVFRVTGQIINNTKIDLWKSGPL